MIPTHVSPQPPMSFPPKPLVSSLIVIVTSIDICVFKYYMYAHLLSYVSLLLCAWVWRLTTRDCTTYMGAHPKMKLILPVLADSDSL